LIILTRKDDVVVVKVFLIATTVVLNHFAEGSQIQTYHFIKEPQKNCTTSQLTRFVCNSLSLNDLKNENARSDEA